MIFFPSTSHKLAPSHCSPSDIVMPVASSDTSGSGREQDAAQRTRSIALVADGDWARSFSKFWDDFADWVLNTLRGINDESESSYLSRSPSPLAVLIQCKRRLALHHPYFISLALIVVWAWPHMLILPVWFGKDAYHRMDSHARETLHHARTTVVPEERPSRRAYPCPFSCHRYFTKSLISH